MGTSIFEKASGFLRRKGKYAVVLTGVLAVTAVGCRMALPGFTLERELVCGLEEHVHTEECYPAPETGTDDETKGEEGVESTTEKVLACPLEGKETHAHTEDCYETEKKLICGQEENGEGHAHGDDCYSTTRELTCGQEELAGHTHDASCYQTETNLSCGQEETAGHSHGDGCYDENGNVICGQEEGVGGHAHSDACYSSEDRLVCGQEESAGHTHGDGCYTESRELTCGQEEVTGHAHTEDCYEEESKIICGKEEYNPADHVHGDECYIEKPVSGENGVSGGNVPEGNGPDAENGTLTEGGEGIERQPICGLEEHTHTDACYGAEVMAIADNVIAYGEWWQLDDEGLLTITATDTVTEIPSYSYSSLSQRPWHDYLSQIKSIKIEGMQKIGDYAFKDCEQLTEVEISEGVKEIGRYAFYYCSGLTSINIPKSVTKIQNFAFYCCSALTSISIPEGVTEIGDYAFYYCKGLTSIDIPEGVTEIGSNAFYNCSGLTSINLPESMTIIGTSTFSGCSSLVEIKLPENITGIGGGAFTGCKSLGSIKLPEGLTRIEAYTFLSCSGLASVNLPESLEEIDNYAFRGCSTLSSINLPEGITSIGKGAFYECGELAEFEFGINLNTIGEQALDSCSGLERIVIKAKNLNPASNIGISPLYLREVIIHCDNVDELTEAVLKWWKAAEVSFEGEGYFSLDSSLSLGRPLRRELQSGRYYADGTGALYLLKDGTASLAYVPAGLAQYTVRNRIPAADGEQEDWIVCSVERDALKMADNLQELFFEKPEDITVLPDYCCGNCISLISVNGKNKIEEIGGLFTHSNIVISSLAFYNTGLEGGMPDLDDGDIEIIVGGQKMLTMSTQKDKEGTNTGLKLYTGEQAVTTLNLSGQLNETDYTVARCYFSFDNKDGMTRYGKNSGDDYEFEIVDEQKNSYIVKARKSSVLNVYYYEIPRPKEGGTLSLMLPSWYESPASAGGSVKIWPVLLTEAERETLGNGVTGDGGRYHQVNWITERNTFPVTKTLYTDSKIKPSIQGGKKEGELYLKNLAYRIEMANENNAPADKGKDHMLSADFTDTLILPDGMQWREEALEAIEAGKCYWYNWKNENKLYVLIGNETFLLCKLSGSVNNVIGNRPEVVREEGNKSFLSIKWNIKNSNPDKEMVVYKDWVLYFGDEVICMDNSQDMDSCDTAYTIANEIEMVQHFTHSKDQVQEDRVETKVQPSEGNCEIDKKADIGSASSDRPTWGDGYKYLITLTNSGTLPYKGLENVHDQLSNYLYIRPVDMGKMFYEAENMAGVKKLEIKISNAVLCKMGATDGGYYPGKEVIGTDGRHYTLTWQDTGIGTEYNAGDIGWDPAKDAESVQLAIIWERGKGITLTGPGGTEEVGNSTNIGRKLEDIGYIVTSKAQYTVTWELEKFMLYSGNEKTFSIPVTVKDSFMLMEQDRLEKRSEDSFLLQENIAVAKAGTKEYTDKLTHQEYGHSKYVYRDYTLQKGVKRNNQEIDTEKDSVFSGDVLDYMLRVEHRENPRRGIVPLVDRMRGAQALLVSVEGNGHLSDNGLEEIEVNGKYYYLLSKEGSYTNIILGGNLTDSITVTRQENGELDTMIRWYLADIEGTGTKNINYEAYVLPSLGDGGGFFSLSNESWLNDHQSHRLYDEVGITGTNVVIEKMIVTSQGESKKPSEDELAEYSLAYEGTATTYRLKIENIGLEREIKGSDIYDVLPLNEGFEWSRENVKISYYDAGDGAYTLKGGDDWQIVKDEDKRCRIIWGEKFELTLKNTIYIYVTLEWPEGDAWEAYVRKYGMERLENTFYCYKLWDKVSHDLTAGAEAYLQKGVIYSRVGSGIEDDEENRFYYTNMDAYNSDKGVRYYVVIYNSGYTKLYLDELQDKLPRGFSVILQNENTGLYVGNETSITDAEGNKVTPTWMQGGKKVRMLDDGTMGIELFGVEKEGYLRYDQMNQKYYLAPGEAVDIRYTCYPGEYTDTDDIATNCVTMPYYDATGGGLKKSDIKVEGPNEGNGKAMKNDGDCYIMTTEEAKKQGFSGGEDGTLWLTSDVDVKRREIIPGITKKLTGVTSDGGITSNLGYANAGDTVNWAITMTNDGKGPITDYTITDAMESPYGYIGTVRYKIEKPDSKDTSYDNELLQITSCEKKDGRMCLTLKKPTGATSLNWKWKKNGVAVGLNELVELQGEDVISIEFVVKSNSYERWEWKYDVSLSGNEGEEELNIRCKSSAMSIPAQGKGILTLSTRNITKTHRNKTYSNKCYITPQIQMYDSDLVTQGNNTEYDGKPSVSNIARVQVALGYTTSSEKRVEEIGYPENNATSEDEKNYILLPGAGSLFRYTLMVDNTKTNKEAMEKLVLIDSLPQPGDHNPFTEEEPRFSGLRVDLAENPQFEVWVRKEGEEAVMLNESQYRLEYSSKTEFAEGDWNGEDTNGWKRDMESMDRTSIRSFRVVILDNGVEGSGDLIPAGASVEVKFTGEISSGEDGEPPMPGEIAWNGFGYRYALKNVGADLESTPLNVGVRLPDVPRLIKELEDAEGNPTSAAADMPFRFLIYQGEKLNLKKGFTDKELADALLAAGREFTCVETVVKRGNSQSEMLVLKDLKKWEYVGSKGTGEETPGENGATTGKWRPTEESWFWKDREKYTIVELPLGEEDIYQFASLGGIKNNSYTFTHSVEQGKKIIAVNSCEGSAAYELPETGGVGSHRYTLAGYLCLVMSCLCLAAGWHLHKKKQADK